MDRSTMIQTVVKLMKPLKKAMEWNGRNIDEEVSTLGRKKRRKNKLLSSVPSFFFLQLFFLFLVSNNRIFFFNFLFFLFCFFVFSFNLSVSYLKMNNFLRKKKRSCFFFSFDLSIQKKKKKQILNNNDEFVEWFNACDKGKKKKFRFFLWIIYRMIESKKAKNLNFYSP